MKLLRKVSSSRHTLSFERFSLQSRRKRTPARGMSAHLEDMLHPSPLLTMHPTPLRFHIVVFEAQPAFPVNSERIQQCALQEEDGVPLHLEGCIQIALRCPCPYTYTSVREAGQSSQIHLSIPEEHILQPTIWKRGKHGTHIRSCLWIGQSFELEVAPSKEIGGVQIDMFDQVPQNDSSHASKFRKLDSQGRRVGSCTFPLFHVDGRKRWYRLCDTKGHESVQISLVVFVCFSVCVCIYSVLGWVVMSYLIFLLC
jgi:hypothetical protein